MDLPLRSMPIVDFGCFGEKVCVFIGSSMKMQGKRFWETSMVGFCRNPFPTNKVVGLY